MTNDLDVLGLLRKYENLDALKKQAADEIERLRLERDQYRQYVERLARSLVNCEYWEGDKVISAYEEWSGTKYEEWGTKRS